MAISAADLARARRYSNTYRVPHNDFSGGIYRDVPSYIAPEDGCYDAIDMLLDSRGKTRKRGGSTAVFSGAQTGNLTQLGAFRSDGMDAVTGLYGSAGYPTGTVGNLYYINRSTGAFTVLLSAGVEYQTFRPFQHLHHLYFPTYRPATPYNSSYLAVSGTTGAKAGGALTGGAMAAGSITVTGITGTNMSTAAEVGMIFAPENGAGTSVYFGRITSIISSSSVTVEPAPTANLTIGAGAVRHYASVQAGTTSPGIGRRSVSFQNRMVIGNIVGGVLFAPAQHLARRLAWSILPTEAGFAANVGDQLLDPTGAFPVNNFVDVSRTDPITAMATVGEGQLLIFGTTRSDRLTGTLTTQTATNSGVSFDVRSIPQSVGCISDRSLQYTNRGLIFASYDGVYAYDGAQMRPIMFGRIADFYRDLIRSGVQVFGSAVMRGGSHYYLSLSNTSGGSTSAYGLLCSLDNLGWSKVTNAVLFDSVADPDDASKQWGLRWWDTTGAPPSMTNGQVIQLQSWFLPTSANKNDADGTAVLPVFQSKSYPEGDVTTPKRFTEVQVEYDLRGSGSPTATLSMDTELDPKDATYVGAFSLPDTTSAAKPTVKGFETLSTITEGPAAEYKVVVNNACDSFELIGITTAHQPRRSGVST